jgi:hypothetical protein
MNIPITKPFFGPEELRAVQEPLESGWVVQGPFVHEFEKRFSAFTRAPHAAAASSCTTALHLAVAALGVERGDDVIVPAFTWVATPNVVRRAVERIGGSIVAAHAAHRRGRARGRRHVLRCGARSLDAACPFNRRAAGVVTDSGRARGCGIGGGSGRDLRRRVGRIEAATRYAGGRS